MNEFRFTDGATLSGTRKLDGGYLVAEAFAARTGIQLYRGAEVGLADKDVVRVYRPEDEVRAPASLATFSHAPITMGHPEQVNATNWQDLAKGEVSTEAIWEDNKIKLPLIIKDAAAIAAIESGTRELSGGYTCQIEFKDGVSPEGEAYDAIQRDIRVNHLAIVPKGRAGPECRIGDDADNWGASPLTSADHKEADMPETLRKIMVDGLQVETTDAGAQAIDKLNATIADKNKALVDANTSHKAALDAKDKELAAKDVELDKLKGAQLSDADLDKRVAARAKLLGDAAKVDAKVKTEGLTDAAVRKAVFVAKLGDDAVKDRSDVYIEARFDALVDAADAAKPDQFAGAMKDGAGTSNTSDLNQTYAERNKSLGDAWMQTPSKEG